MIINMSEAQLNFDEIVESLIEGKIYSVTITKDGVPVAEMSTLKRNSKRIGAAKEELKDFNLSQEEFDSIKVEGF